MTDDSNGDETRSKALEGLIASDASKSIGSRCRPERRS